VKIKERSIVVCVKISPVNCFISLLMMRMKGITVNALSNAENGVTANATSAFYIEVVARDPYITALSMAETDAQEMLKMLMP